MNKDIELIGGPEHRDIILVPYNKSWPKLFEAEKLKIKQALKNGALRIEHIGSTSVEGLTAKPIIDIQLTVLNPNDESGFVPALENAGYQLRVREPGHRMMRTKDLSVHIHICEAGSDWERRHILFRDYLRQNTEDRTAYEALKIKLVKQNWETMNHYADAKSKLIQDITGHAELWATENNWTLG